MDYKIKLARDYHLTKNKPMASLILISHEENNIGIKK